MVHIPIYWNKFSWEILINSFVNFVCPCQLCLPRYVTFFPPGSSPLHSLAWLPSPLPGLYMPTFCPWICWLPPSHSHQSDDWLGWSLLGCIILLLKLHPTVGVYSSTVSLQAWKLGYKWPLWSWEVWYDKENPGLADNEGFVMSSCCSTLNI